MNKERGIGKIGLAFHVIFLSVVMVAIVYAGQNIWIKEKNADIKANMLLIQGSCKVKEKTATVNNDESILIGTKVSDVHDDSIINEFEEKNVISQDDYDDYYVLSNDDLEKLSVEVKNEKGAYYLINYSSGEVITTKAYNGKYKLSEISE